MIFGTFDGFEGDVEDGTPLLATKRVDIIYDAAGRWNGSELAR
jgi:hypothetical protein